MSNSITHIEVRGSRVRTYQELLSIEHAVEVKPRRNRPFHFIKLGKALATAYWINSDQRMVIRIQEDDDQAPVTSALFARLAAKTGGFEIAHDRAGEVRYEFAYAS